MSEVELPPILLVGRHLRKQSKMLDPALWQNQPIYFLKQMAPYISNYAQNADDASFQAQIDVFGRKDIGARPGALGPRGNFAALLFSEAEPDRIALLAYSNEVLSFYECFEKELTDSLEATFTAIPLPKDPKFNNPVWQANYKTTMAKWPAFLSELDPKLGPKCMKSLVGLLEGVDMAPKMAQYQSIREYIKDRINFIAWPVVCDNSEFGQKLDLTADASNSLNDIFVPLWEHSVCVFDYYHYEKEVQIYTTYGSANVQINAIPLLQRLRGLSVEDCKTWLKTRAFELEQEYLRRKEDYFKENPAEIVPEVVHRQFLAQEDLAAGFAIWCATSYHNHPPWGEGYIAPYEKRLAEGAIWHDNVTDSDRLMTDGFKVKLAAQNGTSTV